jgi:arylsulfatase A-like enzyme
LPTTPNFERLAKTSHVFSHFYSSTDFTTPAVVSLITGKDLFSHHVYQLTGMLPSAIREQTLPHLLALDGYRTAAVVTNKYAHPLHLGIDDSFDYLPEPPANPWLRPVNWPLQMGHTLLFDSDASPTSWIVNFLGTTGEYFPSFNQNPSVDPAEVFALSERLIDSVSGPLFIWIHLLTPHFPYVTKPPFRGRFLAGDRYTTQADFNRARRIGHYRKNMQSVFDQLRARYDESIAESDAGLGSFLDWLNSSGRRTRTLLVVSADHGETFHQWWGHESPFLLYPEVHIPLLISLPRQQTSVWHNEDAGLPDVAPTILAVLGIAPPPWMTGHVLLGSSSANTRRQPAFAAYLARSYAFGPPRVGAVAAFSGDYQLVWFFPLGVRQLFDIRDDPYGTLDAISHHRDIAASLTSAIRLRFGAEVPALRRDE